VALVAHHLGNSGSAVSAETIVLILNFDLAAKDSRCHYLCESWTHLHCCRKETVSTNSTFLPRDVGEYTHHVLIVQ
jgi:hypothetical protein